MNIISLILVILLGVLHIGIMGLEMFAKPETQSNAFDMPLEFVKSDGAQTALKNQGIYNGVLGAIFLIGLMVFSGPASIVYFRILTGFVLVVGLYGGFTATKKIFLIQALPGAIALISLFF